MEEENKLRRVLALMICVLAMCTAMFYLPDKVFDYPIKKVDLLSDLRADVQELTLDSLRRQLELQAHADSLEVDSVALRDSIRKEIGLDSAMLALRDSLYRVIAFVEGADSTGSHIEDYSLGHIGLQKFFAALGARDTLGRPVYVAFLGDSFIEGDILVADFRSAMQQAFGGGGIGFVPITSVAAQYRPTVEQSAEGWKTWSMMTDHSQAYTLSGLLFEPEGDSARVTLRTTDRYPESETVSSFKFYYQRNKETEMRWSADGGITSETVMLPSTDSVSCYARQGNFQEIDLQFTHAKENLLALGIALESDTGVIVDNYSLRGSSGSILHRLDSVQSRALNAQRPYDLVILQYGLNVASDSVLSYGWYGRQMEESIKQVRRCFPTADVLLLSVSDRSRQIGGKFETMPAVLALLHAQRQTARRMGIPFWNLFGAMGGENSMVKFVEKNWASKDYTHLGFPGGKALADSLFNALMRENTFYDEAAQAGY